MHPHLSHDYTSSCHPHHGRFTSHVRSRQQHDARRIAPFAHLDVVGNKVVLQTQGRMAKLLKFHKRLVRLDELGSTRGLADSSRRFGQAE